MLSENFHGIIYRLCVIFKTLQYGNSCDRVGVIHFSITLIRKESSIITALKIYLMNDFLKDVCPSFRGQTDPRHAPMVI